MFNISQDIALYIHFPWCVKKCPYCDFNSHPLVNATLSQEQYLAKLKNDFNSQKKYIQGRKLTSIFIGGGTPSLFEIKYLEDLLNFLLPHFHYDKDIEITLEANPATIERTNIYNYANIGINRLSIGVQSFQDEKLKSLGRLHSVKDVYKIIEEIHTSKINNFNIDIMHGLPNQSINDGLFDIQEAIKLKPTHISWYQLTIEPNTLFASRPPKLPDEDVLEKIELGGKEILSKSDFSQYEVSAFAKDRLESKHNKNYWLFGDYIGIGAGAHSKITYLNTYQAQRIWQEKHPKKYFNTQNHLYHQNIITSDDLVYEFMLNALRLKQGFDIQDFENNTFLKYVVIYNKIKKGISLGLLIKNGRGITTTQKGYLFLNDVINLFL